MATRQDIEDSIGDALVSAVNAVGLSEAQSRVRLRHSGEPNISPIYTVETFESDVTGGIGGDTEGDDSTVDADAATVTVTRRRRRQLTLDIGVQAGEDHRRIVTQMYEAAGDAFHAYTRPDGEPSQLHADVREVTVEDSQNLGNPEDAVRGERLRVQITYHRYYESTEDLLDTVDIELAPDVPEESSTDSDDGTVTADVVTADQLEL